MPAFVISTDEAKQDKLFYVVTSVIIVDSTKKACLLLKRGENEKVLPGKWSYPGGKLEHKDVKQYIVDAGTDPIDGVDNIFGKLGIRESKEECGLDVQEDARIIKNKVFIRPDGIPVVMVTLVSEYIGGAVVIEDGAISDYAWVGRDEVDNYDCINGVSEEIKAVLS